MKTDYVEFHQAQKIADTLVSNPKESKKRIGLYIFMQIYTGLRYSDVIEMTFEQIRDNESIRIKETKTKKSKTLYLHPTLRNLVNTYFPEKKYTGQMFVSNKNTLMTSQYISRELKKVFDNDKLNISTHSLRKAFGRHFYNVNGQNDNALTYLSEIYNHSSVLITKKYLGIRGEEIKTMQFNM